MAKQERAFHSGPIDPSVLVCQSTHRSRAVWTDVDFDAILQYARYDMSARNRQARFGEYSPYGVVSFAPSSFQYPNYTTPASAVYEPTQPGSSYQHNPYLTCIIMNLVLHTTICLHATQYRTFTEESHEFLPQPVQEQQRRQSTRRGRLTLYGTSSRHYHPSKRQVKFTLWDDHVDQLSPYFNSVGKDPVILLIRMCKVKFMDICICSSFDATQLFFTHSCKKFRDLKNSYTSNLTPLRCIDFASRLGVGVLSIAALAS